MILGFSILILSGICQGSFGLGYKKYNPLSWEAFWGVYSLFCMIIAAAWTFIIEPNALHILFHSRISEFMIPFICGICWGLSTIAFSKSVLTIGMSLCFGINMGVSAVIGTIIPFVTLDNAHSQSSFAYLITGILITLIGIGIITNAGIKKEQSCKSKNTKLGIALAIISGLCSGIMNIGFDKASVLGKVASSVISASAIQWFPVLIGGMTSSIIYCIVLMLKNKTWNTYFKPSSATRLVKLFITSIIWFLALALYGISSKMIGTYGSSIGWLLFNAVALIVSNLWGILTGEWKSSKKALRLLIIGDIILIIAWVVIMQVN